jgi:dihydroorotase
MAAYDLVLKGGRVVDPGQSLDAKMDVAFLAGKVAAIAKTIAVPAGVEARGHFPNAVGRWNYQPGMAQI